MSKSRQSADRAYSAGKKNLIMNGGFKINQRTNGVNVPLQPTGSAKPCDRFYARGLDLSGGDANITIVQNNTYSNVMQLNVTSAMTAPTYGCAHHVEQLPEEGTTLTYSYMFESTVDCRLQSVVLAKEGNIDVSLGIVGETSVTANTPTKISHTFTVAGLTGAAPQPNDKFTVIPSLDDGVAGPQVGTYSFSYMQLEVGSEATDFEIIDEATQLLQCQRYFERVPVTGQSNTLNPTGIVAVPVSTTVCYANVSLKVAKRTSAPIISMVGNPIQLQYFNQAPLAIASIDSVDSYGNIQIATSGTLVADQVYHLVGNVDAAITFDSELI